MNCIWKIIEVEHLAELNGLQNVVTKAKVGVTASNGIGEYTFVFTSILEEPSESSFKAFESLSSENVLEFVRNGLSAQSIAAIEQSAITHLASALANEAKTSTLPFSQE